MVATPVKYKIHAQKEQHSSSLSSTLIQLTHDQAILILLPQGGGQYLFKRLTAWHTVSPKEETLSFVAPARSEAASGYQDLKVDPDGHYAVIRLMSFSGAISSPNQSRSAVIVIIDLSAFTILSQRSTTDILLASGEWAFADGGKLIVSALAQRSMTPEKPKNGWAYDTIADDYRAAALTLPSLAPSMPCQYTLFLDHRTSSARSDRYLSKSDEGCRALVAIAQVPSVENLPDGPPKPVPYASLAGPACQFGGLGPNAQYALYGCRTGHDYLDGMVVTTNTRNLTVLKLPDGQRALEVPLPHNTTPYPALLASAADRTWLLLLRDGINLECYSIQ